MLYAIYTLPSGKQFECEVLCKGANNKSLIRYKDGKNIVEMFAFNKRLTKLELSEVSINKKGA